jgi:hypothetical protein
MSTTRSLGRIASANPNRRTPAANHEPRFFMCYDLLSLGKRELHDCAPSRWPENS